MRLIQPLGKDGGGERLEHRKYSLFGGIITSQAGAADVCHALVRP